MNQDDPETVRDGAPAYLLLLDSFIAGFPDDPAMLAAAAELYAAYGVIFVADAERADRLTQRALSYGQRSLCASNQLACGIHDLSFKEFEVILQKLDKKDAASLFTYGLSSIAYIKAHSDDWGAMAKLPGAEAALNRVKVLDPGYQAVQVEHYLAVLNTIRPPALGGNFEAGKAYYERALTLSGGKDLSINVDYARYYARTLYDRELHDRLLKEVISAEPNQDGYTLFNTLAQREAQELLDSADDYF
jgi:tetratricopeptide (TPR) repeat protein